MLHKVPGEALASGFVPSHLGWLVFGLCGCQGHMVLLPGSGDSSQP